MTDSRLPPSTLTAIVDDFSSAPFRLLFLSACTIGVIAALCWTIAMQAYWPLRIDPLSLHAFLFLQSFSAAAFSGFLLTAIPEWTHYTGKLTRQVQILWLLWLTSSIGVFFSLTFALMIMLGLWIFLSALAIQILLKKKSSDHFSVLAWIIAFSIMSGVALINAWQYNIVPLFLWQQLVHIAVMGVALISFRIARALGNQALEDGGHNDSVFIPNPFYKNLAVWLFYILIISNLWLENETVEGWLNLAISGVMLARLRDWHFFVLLKRHYIRWLYLTLCLIGCGYGWRGAALIGISQSPFFNPVLPFHLITIGGFLLMAFQVFHIAGLRHSNRDLIYPPISRFAMLCILLGALSRSLGVALGGNYLWFAMHLPGIFISLAFAAYIPIFYKIFIQYPAACPSEE